MQAIKWQNMKSPTALLIARCIELGFILSSLAVLATAQQLIGAKAGIVQYARGESFIDGTPFRLPTGSFRQMENGQALSTKKGFAELVLTPTAYLRLGENALLQMRNNKLDKAQLELIRGSALIEVYEKIKTNPIVVRVSKSTIEIRKAGLYRINAIPGELRVYSGAALARNGSNNIQVTKGRMVFLEGDFACKNFDRNDGDALQRWAIVRSSVNAYWRFYGYQRKYPKPFQPDPELKLLHDEYQREMERNAAQEQKRQLQLPGMP
jgi:hypothetical protein